MEGIRLNNVLEKISILYVEDDEKTRNELLFPLTSLIEKVYVAENGSVGKDMYFKYKPDIIITDIQMPIMNGLDMIQEIKQISPDAIVIVLTAFNDTEYLFSAIELGVNHYLTKPMDLSRLLNQITKIAEQIQLDKKVLCQQHLLEQYRDTIDSASIVCKFNTHGVITFVNDNFKQIFGYKDQDILENTFAIMWDNPSESADFDECFNSMQKLTSWRGKIQARSSNGSKLFLEAYMIPQAEMEGRIIEFVLIALDFTELYRYREFLEIEITSGQFELRKNMHYLDQYREILNATTAVCIIDLSGQILDSNIAFRNLLFYSIDELKESKYADLIFNSVDSMESIILSLENGKIHKSRNYLYASNDQIKILDTTFSPIRDMSNKLEKIVCIHFDMTELINAADEIVKMQNDMLMTLGEVAEKKSRETGEHIKRVSAYSQLLAQKYGLDKEQCTLIGMAAPMHDIGKIAVPEHILNKPDPLSDEEMQIMRLHSITGYDILNHSIQPLMKLAAIIALQHHEYYNGQGYPTGISGEEIDIAARIVAVADVFDSLSNDRVYKKAWEQDAVLALFREERGKQFDPVLVDILLENIDGINKITAEINTQSKEEK
jgi:PAS domain S-box-containing protein